MSNPKPWDKPKGGRGAGGRSPKQQIVERGTVAAVPSGDRIVVFLQDNNTTKSSTWQPPKKKEIKLSWINAPRLSATWYEGDEEHYREPEDFSWQSREYLRSLAIGKPVEITIHKGSNTTDNKNTRADQIPRELGTVVFSGQKEDLSKTIVSAGWAEVRTPENLEKAPQALQELLNIQTEAAAAGKGVHAKKSKESKSEPIHDFDHFSRYKEWKDTKLRGIVENILSGSMLRIVLLPSLHSIVLRIAGVRAPTFKKDGKGNEPYGREAHWTAERYTLHRDVEIRLTGFDRDKKEDVDDAEPSTGTFYGEILIKDASIGELLLQHGLATLVEWSAPKDKIEKYRQLEQSAKDGRVRIWGVEGKLQQEEEKKAARENAFVARETAKADREAKKVEVAVARENAKVAAGVGGKWTGVVKGVTSANTLTVEHKDAGRLETVTLSGINVPRIGREDTGDEPLAWEARNFIRKRVIGKQVNLTVDYVVGAETTVPGRESKFQPKLDRDGKPLPPKAYYTVESEGTNLALALVENGFATVIERGGNNRSIHYDALLLAQDRAKKQGVGLHSKNVPRRSINDVSRDSRKAKTLLTGLLTKPFHDAVVEYVVSGSKLKLHLPKESLLITFSLAGVRTPSVPPKAKPGEQQKETPPFAVEAADFTRNFCHHMDVTVEIDGQDKTGAFKGYLWKGKQHLGQLLLEAGLAEQLPSKKYEDVFANAEQRAKENKLRMWINHDPAKEEEEREKRELERQEGNKKVTIAVRVTEVTDATQFYVQIEGDDKKKLDDLMALIAKKDWKKETAFAPDRGDVVLAQFSGDDVWYRAKVLFVTDKGAKVLYGDYGNAEFTETDRIRELPDEFGLSVLKFQARECNLAYIQPQKAAQEYGEKGALLLRRLVWDKPLIATIESGMRQQVWQVVLWDEEKVCINGELVRKGLARVQRVSRNVNPEFIAFLREEEDKAHNAHKGMWRYGDIADDESD